MNLTTRSRMGWWLASLLFLIGASPTLCAADDTPEVQGDPVMTHVLAAELAASDGDGQEAAKHYLQAALMSEEPGIAERATRVALEAQAWQYAGMAADRWTQLAPFRIDARQTAVRTFLIAGDYEQAAWQLSRLLELTADTAWQGWPQVANLVERANNAEKAEHLLQRLVEEQGASGNPYALLAQSQAVARSGDMARATTLAQQAVDAGADELPLHVWMGRLALTQGQQAEALEAFRAAAKLDPDNAGTGFALAELLAQQGEVDEAAEVLAALPDTPANRFNRVVFASKNMDRAAAMELYGGFATMADADATARAVAGAQSAELLGLNQDAIDWYTQLAGTEHDAVATRRRAVLMAQDGRLDEARALLQSARNSGRVDVRLETTLLEAQLLSDAKQYQEAIDLLGQGIDMAPDSVPLHYTRALISVQAGDIETAEADLRFVLDMDPNNPNALNALGYTLADRTDRLDEAETLINAAYALAPEEAAIIDSMGWIAFRRGRLEQAEQYLRRAFAMEQNAEIAAHLGEVLWAQGRKDDARAVWGEGAVIDPEDAALIETRKRLDPPQ
ncbi:tetratricopeptide repeat protein [Marinihelvus fidelis]|uniref:Tetratricopeptide repeat protein n=1 Tax=Marinihelvus fidelis TaxID=2613842 RepID=A0A5N0TDC6_9GAMM|nr:tetratricopeptide repeat protein [Marinihelvus fidelis]KAA9132464.1 tetratricopeptide repeat protein [Marinihelvus fidelis]